MRSTATIKGRSCRAFQHGHIFDIIGVYGRDTIAQIIAASRTSTAEVGIVQGHTINDIKGLVVARHLRITTQQHTGGTRGTTGCILNDEACHLARKRVYHIRFLGLGQLLSIDLRECVAQSLALTLDAEGSNDHLVEHLTVVIEQYIHAVLGFDCLRLIAYIADFEHGTRLAADGEVSIQVSHRTSTHACYLDRSSNQRP